MSIKLKLKKFGSAVSLTLLISFLWGCGFAPEEDTDLAPPLLKPNQEQYVVEKVKKKDIAKSVKGLATFISLKENPLYFTCRSQRLKSLNVKYGDFVKKGDVIAELESGDLDDQVKDQQYELQKLQLDYDFKKDKFKEITSKADNSIDLKEYEKNLKIQEISLTQAKDKLNKLKQQYSDLKLISNVSGKITNLADVKRGDVIDPYRTIASISDVSNLQLYLQSDSTKDLKLGMKANITYKNKEYTGSVSINKENAPKEQTEKFNNAVVISLDSPVHDSSIGDFADAVVIIQSKKDALVIPSTAVKKFMGANTVQIMEGTSKKEVGVELGIQTSTEVEILTGVTEGQSIIIR